VAAGLGPPTEHALISLLALNGLRVSEATGADIEHLGLERGHRTLTITRKGGKVVTIPLAPRTARAIDVILVNARRSRRPEPSRPVPRGIRAVCGTTVSPCSRYRPPCADSELASPAQRSA
jgi:integrase